MTRAALDLRFLAHGVLKASKHREPTVQPTRPSRPVWGFEPIRCIAYHAVRQASPALRAAFGVGPDTAAQLLITAGSNPERLTASVPSQHYAGRPQSKHRRERLTGTACPRRRPGRGQCVAPTLVRMANHRPTRAYVARQTANGRSKREIIRMLKRAIAREIYRLLTHPAEVPNYADLRTVRQAKNITVTVAARHLDVWPAVISRLERGLRRDDDLARQYRSWLAAA